MFKHSINIPFVSNLLKTLVPPIALEIISAKKTSKLCNHTIHVLFYISILLHISYKVFSTIQYFISILPSPFPPILLQEQYYLPSVQQQL